MCDTLADEMKMMMAERLTPEEKQKLREEEEKRIIEFNERVSKYKKLVGKWDEVRGPIYDLEDIGFICERPNFKKALYICKDTEGKPPTIILYNEKDYEYLLIFHGKRENYLLQHVTNDRVVNNQYYHKIDLKESVIEIALGYGFVFIKGDYATLD